MLRVFLLSFSTFVLIACASNEKGAETSTESNLSGAAAYKKHCVLCHGLDGKKAFAGAGDLTVSEMSYDEIVKIITEGKNENPGKIMTPFSGVLNTTEIEKVAKFVEKLRE